MKSVHDFLEEFEFFVTDKKKKEVWLYSGHTYLGSTLIKNIENGRRIFFKPSESGIPIGAKKIQNTITKIKTYRGYTIDNYIFIGYSFKEISKRTAKFNKLITLITLDLVNKKIQINGAMNIDINILNLLIEFAELKNISVSYDFEGLLKHQSFDKKEEKIITQIEERIANPVVFFSYSWDNDDHRFWVLKLAAELIKNGIDVLIDEWDLDKFNYDLHLFMETGIRTANKVVLICTQKYAEKANERKGGVGVENTIITGEFYDDSKINKFIPIVREYDKKITDSLPSYLKTKFSIDFSKDNEFRQNLEELERKILNIPRYKKPTLGSIPKFRSDEI